jgi:EpsI family protein
MTKSWTIYLPIAAAVVLMVSVGYVQGVWSERWGTFPELKIFSDHLRAIPAEIGEWKGTDAAATDEKLLAAAGAEGELVRTYQNSNGDQVRVSLICGRLQDITYHTPERCYPAAGFEMQGPPQHEVIELPTGQEAHFLATNFTKSERTGSHAERGYWSITGDGNWQAPENTKYAFASQQRALYKLYVFANLPVDPKKRASDRDFCKEFIQVFIPTLNDALRPAFEEVGRIDKDTGKATAAPKTDAKTDEKPAA